MSAGAKALTGLVRTYQLAVGPLHGPTCRFYPSCSEYAVGALARFGAIRGSALAAKRILRCNPWNPGGYDPVPPATNEVGDIAAKDARQA